MVGILTTRHTHTEGEGERERTNYVATGAETGHVSKSRKAKGCWEPPEEARKRQRRVLPYSREQERH